MYQNSKVKSTNLEFFKQNLNCTKMTKTSSLILKKCLNSNPYLKNSITELSSNLLKIP